MLRNTIVYCSDSRETVCALAAQGLPVIYLEREGAEPCYEAAWVWQCTKEEPWPDETFLEKVWRRTKRLPWLICTTERLLIRESVPEDLEAFLRFYEEESGNPDVGHWSGRPAEQLQNYIDGQYRTFGYGLWTVTLRETGEVIGRAGLVLPKDESPEEKPTGTAEDNRRIRNVFFAEKQAEKCRGMRILRQKTEGDTVDCLEISWLIGRRFRRQGYAREAAEAILQYAFRELECGCVIARASERNKASLSLMEKLAGRD